VVLRCLAKAPEDRFESMEALAVALRPFVHGPIPLVVPAQSALPVLVRVTEAASRRRRPSAWVAAGLAMLAIPSAVVWSRAGASDIPVTPPAIAAQGTTAAQGLTATQGTTATQGASTAQGQPVMPETPSPARVLLQVRSTPSGARVIQGDTGETLGVTPFELPVSEPRALRFELKGHQPAQAVARPEEGAHVEVTLSPNRAKAPAGPRRGARLHSTDGLLNPFRK
jgi:hypothetical protein